MEEQDRGNEGAPSQAGVEATGNTGRQVMSGMTVKELEMLPRQQEISRLTEIPVGGVTNISEEVLGAIAGVAVSEVQGVARAGAGSIIRGLAERIGGAERRARGIQVEAGRREAVVDVTIRVIYGYSVPEIVVNVRRNIADRFLNLCGLVAKEINVRVAGMEFPERESGRVQ